MTSSCIYMDHNATSPLRPCCKEALHQLLTKDEAIISANPNSSHALGQKARARLEAARESMAKNLKVKSSELVFTASATEANFLALLGLWRSRKKQNPKQKRILSCEVEHGAVYENIQALKEHEGAEIVWVKPQKNGAIDPQDWRAALESFPRDEWAFASCMAAHNETGVIQPWTTLAKISADFAIPFHSDLAQIWGRVRLPENGLAQLGLSTASLTFHKMGGPKGVGLLWIRSDVNVEPVMKGGGQEKKRRAGTQNLLGILAASSIFETSTFDELLNAYQTKVRSLRDDLEAQLFQTIGKDRIQIVGTEAERLPNTSYVIVRGLRADALLMSLDLAGICASSGSACSSGMSVPSRALISIGYGDEESRSAVRLSLGPETTQEEVNRTVQVLSQTILKAAAA